MRKKIIFCKHAYLKFKILRDHAVRISQKKVREAIKEPDSVTKGYGKRKIAQKILDKKHILRVIFEDTENSYEIITFYPARRQRYENEL